MEADGLVPESVHTYITIIISQPQQTSGLYSNVWGYENAISKSQACGGWVHNLVARLRFVTYCF